MFSGKIWDGELSIAAFGTGIKFQHADARLKEKLRDIHKR